MAAHLTLAASRADNFYYPPEWDPSKGSLDKFLGKHALGDRAKKLDQGILVIRFEMPFNVWCDGCGELIGKGVRFNAEKKQVGTYLSTRIWSFKMHHHCGCEIEVVTDPKTCKYLVPHGAKLKEEQYSASDAQVLELPDDDEKAKLASDPIFRMEKQQGQQAKAKQGRDQLSDLLELQHRRTADGNAYKLNKELKRRCRSAKKDAAARNSRREAMGLAEHITLLPTTAQDAAEASQALARAASRRSSSSQKSTRRNILEQDIFSGVSKPKTKSAPPSAGRKSSKSVAVKAAKLSRQRV